MSRVVELPQITLLKETAKKSLFFTAKALCRYKDVNESTHGSIVDNLESDTRRKLICVPRGCLKSSLACVSFPIWLLINNPNLRILIDSEVYTNSSKFLREIKMHLESNLFRTAFGNWVGPIWKEDEIVIAQRTAFKKEGSITAGGVGTVKVGQHYDVIIGDDYNSPKNSNSPENAEKVVNHYKYNLSILDPDGTYVLIGTRYSASDVIGYILTQELGLEEGKVISGEYEPKGLLF